jgi:NAD(P)-dependent dehydrogenase (short-subunit alcohol dehydrogenase family)
VVVGGKQGHWTIHHQTVRLGRRDVFATGRKALEPRISEFSTLGAIPDRFHRGFGLNVRSLLFATKEAVELMPDGGTVVLIGAIAGIIGRRFSS